MVSATKKLKQIRREPCRMEREGSYEEVTLSRFLNDEADTDVRMSGEGLSSQRQQHTLRP